MICFLEILPHESFCLYVYLLVVLLAYTFPSIGFASTNKEAIDDLTPMVVTAKGGF